MAEYRTIKISFWNDPFIEELEPNEKLLYLYLFTSPHTSNIGLLEVTSKKIAFETGLSIQGVNSGLSKLEKERKIIRDGQFILVARFIKNQSSTSPKLIQSMRGIAKSITSQKIRDTLCILYPDIFSGVEFEDTVSIPYNNDIDTVSIPIREKEEEKEREIEEEYICPSADGDMDVFEHSVQQLSLSPEPQSQRKKKTKDDYTDDFISFWQEYPRKEDKKKAFDSWRSLEKKKILPDINIILKAIDTRVKSGQWENKKFIPLPTSWLNGRRWEDEVTPIQDSRPSYAPDAYGRRRAVVESEQNFDDMPRNPDGTLDWSRIK